MGENDSHRRESALFTALIEHTTSHFPRSYYTASSLRLSLIAGRLPLLTNGQMVCTLTSSFSLLLTLVLLSGLKNIMTMCFVLS